MLAITSSFTALTIVMSNFIRASRRSFDFSLKFLSDIVCMKGVSVNSVNFATTSYLVKINLLDYHVFIKGIKFKE
jgi:hypothetical protein